MIGEIAIVIGLLLLIVGLWLLCFGWMLRSRRPASKPEGIEINWPPRPELGRVLGKKICDTLGIGGEFVRVRIECDPKSIAIVHIERVVSVDEADRLVELFRQYGVVQKNDPPPPGRPHLQIYG